jgi:hypothetical protein
MEGTGQWSTCNTARFESRDACMAALQATAKDTDIKFDEREKRTREIYNLVDAVPTAGEQP